MQTRKYLTIIILLTLMFAPALSYASGCCCLNSAQKEISAENSGNMPCHDKNKTDTQIGSSDMCMCDAGTLTHLNLNFLNISENNIYFNMVYNIDLKRLYQSINISPSIPPPILFS